MKGMHPPAFLMKGCEKELQRPHPPPAGGQRRPHCDLFDAKPRSRIMKTRTKLAIMAMVAAVAVGSALWQWHTSASPIVGLWIDQTGEQIRFRANGVFSMVENQPLIGNMFSVPRDEQYMQGRYTFLDSTHIRTEFKYKMGSPRVFVVSPTGDLFWTNLQGQSFRYEKRRIPL